MYEYYKEWCIICLQSVAGIIKGINDLSDHVEDLPNSVGEVNANANIEIFLNHSGWLKSSTRLFHNE